jgi:hypothetical protein
MLPSSEETIGGSGVYALSPAGRARFKDFPLITADDAFVRRQFRPDERTVVREATAIVTPPTNVWDLVKIKTRSHYGNLELDALYPEIRTNRGRGNRTALIRLCGRPWLWWRLAVYLAVQVLAKVRARSQWRSRKPFRWERDESSRPTGRVETPSQAVPIQGT